MEAKEPIAKSIQIIISPQVCSLGIGIHGTHVHHYVDIHHSLLLSVRLVDVQRKRRLQQPQAMSKTNAK
jgi:hypothetical protein